MLPATPPALDVQNLTVRFGGFTAVDDVSLSVTPGSIVGLIGPNGAGKSSCFAAIGGNVKPKEGTVSVHGRQLSRNNPYVAWKAGIGRTYQRTELFWTLTVLDHVELAARKVAKLRSNPLSSSDILELVGITALRDAVVGNLPLGTTRLVELARAIACAPSVILMDEPCSGLDHKETAEMARVIAKVRQEHGYSILIVEHDMDFILTMADRLYVLSNGRLIAEGAPEEIRSSPVVRSAYLGSAG